MTGMARAAFFGAWLCLIACFAPRVRAQVAAGTAGAIAAGAARSATAAPAPDGFPGSEPEDWLDPRTGSTSVLVRGCNVVADVSLTVTPGWAFVNVVLLNESEGEPLAFEPSATHVLLGSGVKRRVRQTIAGDLLIQPGWQQPVSMPLSSKAELRGIGSLGVELTVKSPSFGACRLEARIVRPQGPEREATFRPYATTELYFGIGPRLLTTGNLHALSPKVGVSFVFDVAAYWSVHHGVALDLAPETLGRGAVSKVSPDDDLRGKGNVEAAGFFLGYLYRFYPVGRLSITYSPEVGIIPFQLTNGQSQDRVEATSAVFCPKHRLRAVLPIFPVFDGSFTLGLSLSHTYVPYGRLGEANLSGNLLNAVLLFGLEG